MQEQAAGFQQLLSKDQEKSSQTGRGFQKAWYEGDRMDYSVAKELVGRLKPEGSGSGQWLDVQVDVRDKWCPSGVHSGTGAV